jgi:molecular chaperone GrpE (heat shock protein)
LIAGEFQSEEGIDLRKDRQALQRLLEAAEKAKVELSGVVQTEINLPFVTADQNGPKHLIKTITRAKFEELTDDLTQRCVGPFSRALEDSKLSEKEIDEVVLVGGSTRMPVIQELVKKLTGKDPHQGVNPDEVVAVGAAIQAGVLMGDVKDVVLLDVTPLSLGIETLGGVNTVLIPRNTTIPTAKSETFSTAEDNQTAVDVHVSQGERPMSRDNMSLARFRLEGIPPAPRGLPQVEVTFDIDANGILNVHAKDLGTGREQSVKVTASTNLSSGDIDRMVREAEQNAQQDADARAVAEERNTADSLAYSTEKTLKDAGDKISETDRQSVERALSELRDALKGNDAGAIRSARESLEQAWGPVASSLYSQSAAGADEQTAAAPLPEARLDRIQAKTWLTPNFDRPNSKVRTGAALRRSSWPSGEKYMTEQLDKQVGASGQDTPLDPRSAEAVTAADGRDFAATSRVEALEQELAAAQQDVAASQDKFLRARADMENYKKRIERTYAELTKSSKKDLLRKVLSVKDNLERALQFGEGAETAGESVLEGVRLTQYQLDQMLQQEGVTPIDAEESRLIRIRKRRSRP